MRVTQQQPCRLLGRNQGHRQLLDAPAAPSAQRAGQSGVHGALQLRAHHLVYNQKRPRHGQHAKKVPLAVVASQHGLKHGSRANPYQALVARREAGGAPSHAHGLALHGFPRRGERLAYGAAASRAWPAGRPKLDSACSRFACASARAAQRNLTDFAERPGHHLVEFQRLLGSRLSVTGCNRPIMASRSE